MGPSFNAEKCSQASDSSLNLLRQRLDQVCKEPVRIRAEIVQFQASVMAFGPRVLQTLSSSSFILEYLELALRILDGSRRLNSNLEKDFWSNVPRTDSPVAFPVNRQRTVGFQ